LAVIMANVCQSSGEIVEIIEGADVFLRKRPSEIMTGSLGGLCDAF
jgi:hypothetical protein